MNKRMIAAAAMVAGAGPVYAEDLVLKPLVDLRLRSETVDQDGFAREAEAVTLRARAGVSATSGALSALVEAQGTIALIDRSFDGLEGIPTGPLVADPENVALYRAQLQYKTQTFAATAGRQRIALDDERFVGAIGFRQNGQTFDAVRIEWSGVPRLKADISYAWSVRTIWGVDGTGARQRAVSGDNLFANISYATPLGTVTGFAYLVDQDEAAVSGYRLSSQSYGIRVAGVRSVGKLKLSYQASYARQSDWRRNPNDYSAGHYLVDAALERNGIRAGIGYEVLGADKGAPLTSFQTPLGTNFKFQGWADKFLTTPPNGVRDLYGSIGYGAKAIGPAKGVMLQATYHRFEADRLGLHYGDELNLLASARFGPTAASIRFADYQAKGFAADTRKLWLQLDWTL